MRALLFLLLCLVPVLAQAQPQSSLPPCPAAGPRHNCFGEMELPAGSRYVGEFVGGKMHGQGTFSWADGRKYVGTFREGNMEGQGTWSRPGGNTYVGEWRNGMPNGQGTRTQADGSRQRVNIVIIDACRNNDLARSWRSASPGLARMDAPAGTFIAFATAPGKVALDGAAGQRNSPFTKNLPKAMQTPNLPIELMFKEVRRMVLEETRNEQVPWDNSSLVGDFVFRAGR